MMGTKLVILISLALALPAFGETYKNTYSVPCSQLWGAVKDTLGNPKNYADVKSDDSKLTASFHPKHSVHVNISGALLQRTNHVTLVPKDTGCEMQVVSNYSGWEHDDQGDFKKRVDEFLAKPKDAAPVQPAQPAQPAAPAQ
jgi:hypothetical protein